MIFEIVGGYLANSLAIMTDAAHMLSDVAGFMISYLAIYLGGRASTFELSYGYARAEILGALASIMLIWGLIIWLFVEAIERFVNRPEVNGEIMLITATVGLACNFVNIFLLHGCGSHGHTQHDLEEEETHDHNHEHSHSHIHEKTDTCHQPILVDLNKQATLRHPSKTKDKNHHLKSNEKSPHQDEGDLVIKYDDDSERYSQGRGVNIN